MSPTRNNQKGISLLVGMIMLVLITLMVVSAFNASDTNLKIVGNVQLRQEANGSAQQAIESTIGTTTFFQDRDTVIDTPVQIDVNGDGTSDHAVQVTPSCYRHTPVNSMTLDINNPVDVPCFGTGATQNSGIFSGGGSSSASLCSDTWWDIQAAVNDASQGTAVEIHQGVTVRVPRTDAENNCN